MENAGGMSAADVIALTKGSNDGFLGGGVGGTLALIIVFILLFGNGSWGGNNAAATLAQSDLQNSLYFQSQDAAIRDLRNNQCAINDSVLTSSYNNLVSMKDASLQLSNSIASLGNLISEQGNATRAMIQQNYINELSDKLQTTRDELSNQRQSTTLLNAINAQTSEILNAQGRYYLNPPCYNTCGGCCNGLY